MKYIIIFIIFSFLSCSLNAHTHQTSCDSLVKIIKTTKDPKQKFISYRNLADIYFEEPAERTYLKLAYEAAQKIGNKEEILDVLMDLTISYIRLNQRDSVDYYMDIIKKEAASKVADSYLAYLRIRVFDEKSSGGKEELEAAMKEELDVFKKADKNNIYIRIEKAYVTGSGLYANQKYNEAVPYLETAYKLAKTLSQKDQFRYVSTTARKYAIPLRFIGNLAKSMELSEEVLKQFKERNDDYYSIRRPFYPIHLFYLQSYSTLLMHVKIMPKDKSLYYINEIKKLIPIVTTSFDKYNCFLALSNYCTFNRDYKKALSYNDSLIKYARVVSPNLIPGLLNVESELYALANDYKQALKSHILYVKTKDSLESKQVQEQLNELQVQYKLDKLTYEKTRMADKNKFTILVILTFVLLFVCVACVYLYSHLKKERRMKKKLSELKEKAEESEKLKTAFINSICHEIRTPLNSIVGFSGIIADESIDCDSKSEFYGLITANSHKLTSLVEHLLTVATLDSSKEKLPCEAVNITDICRQEMNRAKQNGDSAIDYKLELPQEDITIQTNNTYLGLVIENLLDNANKFTTQGEIKLRVSMDENQNRVCIDVTDTGSGIPLEKQEYVFQRFAKLDSFVQGNGLGLYLCRMIVERLSGSIHIDSEYTNGVRLVISLPVT